MSSSSGSTALDHPAIYAIDAATGKAVEFMSFKSTDLLKAVDILK